MSIDRDRDDVLRRLTELEIEYWYEVDFDWGRTVYACYVADGVFAIGDLRMVGHDAIAKFYTWRERRGDRTVRHVVTNFRLGKLGGEHATLQCLLLLHAAHGKPELPSKPPIMIADIFSECVFCADGQWRFQSHILVPIFMGGELPTIPGQKT